MNTTPLQAYRAQLLRFVEDPNRSTQAIEFESDGLLVVDAQGCVLAWGAHDSLVPQFEGRSLCVHDYRDRLLMPGFIDAHVHYSQVDIVASPAESLLPWLEGYTFPCEERFSDPIHAQSRARLFLDQLLGNGTTTAATWCTVHASSVDAFFEDSHRRNLRMIAGKVLMDQHCPPALQDTAQSGHDDSQRLIERWHTKGRQNYALTPRFALTSSPAQLESCSSLARAHPSVFLQTHVAEHQAEVERAKELFPQARSYLDIYERYELLRPRSLYAHCVHLDETDRARLQATGASAVHCPTSNLFLGSGLFDLHAADQLGVRVALGTDVGAGTSLSMFQTMNEAYKVARLRGHSVSGARLFYLATLGGARALSLEDTIGSLRVGSEADFIVLNPQAIPLLAHRWGQAHSLEERLFALALLGDERVVQATYSAGLLQHERVVAESAP